MPDRRYAPDSSAYSRGATWQPADALASVSVIFVCVITHQWTTDADRWSLDVWRIINSVWLGAALFSCALEIYRAKYEPASITYNLLALLYTFYSVAIIATSSSNFAFVINILLCVQCYIALMGSVAYIGYRVYHFREKKLKQ